MRPDVDAGLGPAIACAQAAQGALLIAGPLGAIVGRAWSIRPPLRPVPG